ncbi:MAG: hypothetical protein IJR55_04575 [Clostridia bacterium]|nr:hypothetical protein [Clostridia bacterium]
MKKITFEKTAFVEHHTGAPVVRASVGYPQIDGCEKINDFYKKWADAWGVYVKNTADKKRATDSRPKARSIRVLPFLRFSDDARADFTFDVIISEDGKLLLYKRTAQSWDIARQTIIKPFKRGKETFYDGERHIMIENTFGKTEARRMSDYVKETQIKKQP